MWPDMAIFIIVAVSGCYFVDYWLAILVGTVFSPCFVFLSAFLKVLRIR